MRSSYTGSVVHSEDLRLRIAAIRFLNPAPLMWDFDHPPLNEELAKRYRIDWMLPSECADRLASGAADLGLVPIASLARNPHLRILPGCTIASKDYVRSLLLVRRAAQPLDTIRTVAADTASRTTVTYARLLFRKWNNAAAQFIPMAADLDTMLEQTDAAVVIGDPALMALEEQANRHERTGEELVYHDLAHEWRSLTGLPFISAVWAAQEGIDLGIAEDMICSRDHGMANVDALVAEWSRKMPVSASTIHTYLTENIHYVLDEECIEGMSAFYRMAAEAGVLPQYNFKLPAQPVSK
jgi:chorismate dehydratase